jgi:prolyl 4-hydroxylase
MKHDEIDEDNDVFEEYYDDDFIDEDELLDDDLSELENVDSSTDSPVIVCEDSNLECKNWKEHGDCENNPDYMLTNCKASCGVCGKDQLGIKFGVAQTCEGEHQVDCQDVVSKMESYFQETVSKPEFDKVRSRCQNNESLCSFWAAIGECDNNPKYMKIHCAAACQTCEQVDFDMRCPRNPDSKDALEPGDLNKLFERIVERYPNVSVLSHPIEGSTRSPWVITLDDFIKPEECDRLIEHGYKLGYARSTDVGAEKFDGTFEEKKSTTRTSENAWCADECMNDTLTQDVLKRIEVLTGIPDTNSEHLQLLKYEVGQFYAVHHDYIESGRERPTGPRILTAFLYLNDVEEGGGTRFSDLDLTVIPKRGRLLLWPSVLNENPSEKDFSTHHQALKVEKGIKFAANAWIHLRDFKGPHEVGCS